MIVLQDRGLGGHNNAVVNPEKKCRIFRRSHMNVSLSCVLRLLLRSMLMACLVDVACRVAPAAEIAPEAYRIYAGSTHAHTQFTWSHGEQWAGAAADESKQPMRHTAEGVQLPPANAKQKENWRQLQGPPAEHFARAKATGTYDFYVVSDHSQDEPLNPPAVDNPAWAATLQQAEVATDASFVALRGYEHSENDGPGGKGHLNVINSAEYVNALAPGMTLPKFYQWLQHVRSAGDGPVVATFNHPAVHQYNDWADRDEGSTGIITMLEVINSNKAKHYAGFVAALDHGWKVSPVCGNDNHGFTGIPRHAARTFVLATSCTKAAILDGMKHRRTYAALDRNIECRYSVNGSIMGSTLNRPDTLEFKISVRDPDTNDANDKITKLDLVTEGGEVAETFEPAPNHAVTWTPTIRNSTKKYYFVRVWSANGGDTPEAKSDQPVAWLAPIWTGR